MFSQTVEYALRAMVQLASEAPAASTTKQIAKKTKVPSAYLAKVLQSMRRAGLINSRRGVGGGVTLALEPEQVSLLDVIDAVEPLKRSGGKSRKAPTPLQRTLDDALAQVRTTFAAASLADMLPKKRRSRKRAAPKRKGAVGRRKQAS
ncbi:MAG: Rrf2 family transcriptional regulator [Pirellulales bacterium]|nr:Rrf2 family transcriptional regulator [Pirellulales bacterium]